MTTPKKKKTKVVQRQWKGGIDYRLSKEQKEFIIASREGIATLDVLQEITDNDYKFSLRYEHKQSCYRGDIFRAYTGYPDSGYMYSVYHRDVATILAIIHYVCSEIFEWELPVGEQNDLDF